MRLVVKGLTSEEGVQVEGSTLYDPSLGYGVVTDEVKRKHIFLQDSEVNTGFVGAVPLNALHFRIDTQLKRTKPEELTKDDMTEDDVATNYTVEVSFIGRHVSLFTTRRRCIFKNLSSSGQEAMTYRFSVHVGAIKTEATHETIEGQGIDLFFIGEEIDIQTVSICEENLGATLFLAGDSTVTDQRANLPYDPYHCYCGWGQMLPLFMKEGLRLSNQAHSGLTTESFRNEGHFDIIKKEILKGDFVAIQFGHNDQKLDHLDAQGGYRKNLERYVDELKGRGALPLLVTSVSRNTWNGPNGAYHDMLEEYAKVCLEVGQEKNVPVLDLHEKSKAFILEKGMEESTKYFHPGDWTHTNDYGGRQMALFVVEEIQKLADAKEFKDYKAFIECFRQPWQDGEELQAIESLPMKEKELLEDQLKGWEKENEWLRK